MNTNYEPCEHGITVPKYCADCRVNYLEQLLKGMNAHIKELEFVVKFLHEKCSVKLK